VQRVATERRFVRAVETVLKFPRTLHDATDLPACKTTATSWYRTTSAPTVLNGRMLNCVTGNQLSASARIIVECKTRSIYSQYYCTSKTPEKSMNKIVKKSKSSFVDGILDTKKKRIVIFRIFIVNIRHEN